MNEQQSLISRYLDDQLSEQEFERLAAWLRADESHRRQYVAWTFDHRTLRDTLGANAGVDALPADADTPTPNMLSRVAAPVLSWINREPVVSAIVAALVVGIVVCTLALWRIPRADRLAEVASPDANGPIVALITSEPSATWAESSEELAAGTYLQIGRRLELEEGMVRIEFFDDSTVLLEGPAALRIDGERRVYLETGKLVVRGTEGFTVATPLASIVDLGTEFGVDSGAEQTLVRVFEGEVEATFVGGTAGGGTAHRLSAGQALRLSSDGNAVSLSSEGGPRFTRSHAPSLRDLIAYEPFRADDFAPLLGQRGGYGFADAWSGTGHERAWSRNNRLRFPESVPFPSPPGHFEYAATSYDEVLLRRRLAPRHLIPLGADGDFYVSFLTTKFQNDSQGLVGVACGEDSAGLEFGWTYSGDRQRADPWAVRGLAGDKALGGAPNKAHQFVVVKITARKVGNDRLRMKVYDSAKQQVHKDDAELSGEGTGRNQWTLVSSEFDSELTLDVLTLRCDGPDAYVQFDEIRIGTSWRAVTGQ